MSNSPFFYCILLSFARQKVFRKCFTLPATILLAKNRFCNVHLKMMLEFLLLPMLGFLEEIVSANNGSEFQWADRAEDRNKLWKARHDCLYATMAERPGRKVWS